MATKKLPFSKNYTKLGWDLFTTIRLDHGNNYYQAGENVELTLCGAHFHYAIILGVRKITLHEVSEELAILDADTSREGFYYLMKGFYSHKYPHIWAGWETPLILLFLMKSYELETMFIQVDASIYQLKQQTLF